LAARAEICSNESGLQEQVIVQETQVLESEEMRVMRKINSEGKEENVD
jgi:hypothetical protein